MNLLSPPAAREPASAKEAGFLLLQRLAPGVGLANLAWAIECAPDFDRAAFAQAFGWLVRRHPSLRTSYERAGEAVLRRTLGAREVPPPLVELAAADEPERARMVRECLGRALDLFREPPIRAVLVATPGRPDELVVTVHHLAVDTAAVALLFAELDEAYRIAVGGGRPVEGEVAPDAPEAEPEPAEIPPDALEYWCEQLAGVDSGRMILTAQHGTEPVAFTGGSVGAAAGAATQEAVRSLRTALRATPNTVLLTAFLALLARRGAGPDLTLGTLVDMRQAEQARRRELGYQAEMLALRVDASGRPSFGELAADVRNAFLEGLANAEAGYDAVLPHLGPAAADWRVPVFRHVLSYWVDGVDLASETVRMSFGEVRTASNGLCRYELEFKISDTPAGLLFRLDYADELFDAATAAAMLAEFERILVRAARDPGLPLAEL